MKNNELSKYTSEEILQILIDFYQFQANFDPEVDKGQKLTFQTTIRDWRRICDLKEPVELAKYYHELFELETNESDLINVLSNGEVNTLKVFCDYLAENATKEEINPTMSMGIKCQEAAIFKTLKNKLEKRGIDTKDLKPSTEFAPFFDKHASELIEVVSKLAPGSLSYYKIKDNIIGVLGALMFLFSIIILIIVLINHMNVWFILISFGISAMLLFVGYKLKPVQYEIGGYRTVRDLIVGMKIKMGSINNCHQTH